jgi:nitronate monooxygenase
MRTRLTDVLQVEHPVMLAGMGGVSYHRLVAAVSEAGGFGCMGASTMGADQMREEIAKVRELTAKPFGVDLLTAAPGDMASKVTDIIDGGGSVFVAGLGVPRDVVDLCHSRNVLVVSMCGKVRHAVAAVEAGCDIVVAQGTEAGGHTGQRTLLPLLQEVLALTDRPVLAAGGIATGAAMAGVLVAGASGVWVGTALLSCTEGLNSDAARERVRAAAGDETVLTRAFDVAEGIAWPERWPGRALVNDFSRVWHGREDELIADDEARSLVVEGRRTGDPATAPLYAGEAVGLVRSERSATDVVRTLDAEAEKALRAASRLLA